MAHKEIRRAAPGEASRGLLRSVARSGEKWLAAGREARRDVPVKADLIAKMSHEFRTPLNIIIGFAELLLDEVPGKINEEQRRSLNDILDSGKRLLDLLNDIVEQSEPRSG